jgi:ABC-type transport system involved in multi-copper enzyme maturation permease subunit
MTALTAPARPEEDDASLRPVPWRRMAGVTWRQHRFALLGVVTLLGALAVYLWIAGLQLHRAYAAAIACHPASSPACLDLVNTFNGMGTFLANGSIIQALPVLIGAFVGAPVLARELETGTYRYAWTQGFGRWRWTLGKLVPLAVAVTTAAGAFGALLSWYYQPYFATPGHQALGLSQTSAFNGGLFDLREVAFPAWTLAAFAIGALAGMLIRRVVPAIAATLAVYAGLAFAAGVFLREHYLTPLLTTNLTVPGSAWILSQWWTKGGTTLSQSTIQQVMEPVFRRLMPAVPPDQVHLYKLPTLLNAEHYLTQHGYTYWTRYQPGSRFWPFQWIEGGWLFALSALLIAVTIWAVRRRAA